MSFLPWPRRKRGSLTISETEPSYKVRYLGNVQTSMMKGSGCVDKPVNVIWSNYLRSANPGLEMKLVVSASGLKAYTKDQGLTDYRAHRLSYCIAHPNYPRLFIWVYRHEGRKMKMELRCHAALCKTEAVAKALAVALHDRLAVALKEFQREKLRKQNSRLVLQRTKSLPKAGSVLPLRKQMLSTGCNFRPPVSESTSAPKLGAIEEHEDEMLEGVLEEEEEEEGEEGAVEEDGEGLFAGSEEEVSDMVEALTLHGARSGSSSSSSESLIDMEVGNDVEALRRDSAVQFCLQGQDSDDESAESGFHDQDPRDLGPPYPAPEEDPDAQSVCEYPSPIVKTEPPSPTAGPSRVRLHVSPKDLARLEQDTVVTQF